MKNKRLSLIALIALLLVFVIAFTGCEISNADGTLGDETVNSGEPGAPENPSEPEGTTQPGGTTQPEGTTHPEIPALTKPQLDPSSIPAYSGSAWIAINENVPSFTTAQITDSAYEYYSELDSLGRCGTAVACLGRELMPTDERGNISSVKPTGWHSVTYSAVSGGSLYNRSHLIAWSLAGENANNKNLITGTQYMNQMNMTEFEDQVRDYIKETGNHVMYRVTPIFEGNDLVATGVQMEAYSVEDEGEGISFNVFLYNVQPNIIINYATGESQLSPNYKPEVEPPANAEDANYLINVSSGKVHHISCSNGQTTAEKNRYYSDAETLEEAIEEVEEKYPNKTFTLCGSCHGKP